ncbi:hypothetical protein BCM02_10587 [Paenibacillus methanolicus]|uniref:Uncharacterized protein n=1 Tax=Paenibacillus methanolicus TaxID=582686 RepID=A0A5S5C987_9BACL|nr:hypothetical protein BCM02_10587 [Paenibacillus methanolicus]
MMVRWKNAIAALLLIGSMGTQFGQLHQAAAQEATES